MKDDRLYLSHILECANRIQEYVKGGREAFLKNQQVQDISQEKSLTGRQSPDNTPRPELGHVGY